MLLVAQLGALIHNAKVRHFRCAEHGELVEPGVADTGELDARPFEGVRFVGVNGGGDTHAHCAIADGLRPHSAPTTLPATATAGDCIAAEQASTDRQSASSTPLYRIAPKTSPPTPG